MKRSNSTKSKSVINSLIAFFSDSTDVPTFDDVRAKASEFAKVMQYDGSLDSVIEQVMSAVDMRMGTGVSLIDSESQHDEKWVRKRKDIEWIYNEAYLDFLLRENWSENVVQSLSDVGDRILGHLQDPKCEGEWDRRGLVIGHVQSGKTANYLGLVAKAADAGYKLIIVIAGVHNNLRKQTQERIDKGFVGRSSDPENRDFIGVGLDHKHFPNYPCPVTITNIYDDFKKQTAAQSGWKLNDFSKPIIFVIKKNVTTLRALFDWLREMNAQVAYGSADKIVDVPLLMIDDEADNASINTNKEDIDPTKTNAMIRKILRLFSKSSYVGYTATPFANIFINPEAYDSDVHEELFPRDFIYCLDAPNLYFGPDKVFLEEETSSEVLRPILDCDDFLPFTHKKNYDIPGMPPSLHRAINQFVIVRAIRNLRGQGDKHCSLMVNVSRFTGIQKDVKDFISIYVKNLRNAVKASYKMPDTIADRNSYFMSLKKDFKAEFMHCGFDWPKVKAELYEACNSIQLFVVNSKSDEVLDYGKYEKDGDCLTAIAVGGLTLSRGLTLEGLTISYMYRNTRMYDTLMQMGRWFGYRTGYDDLCRVYLSPESIDWYSHIAEASEELRQQIRNMRRRGLSPKQFGLYVLAHPDRLLITARNKMLSSKKVTTMINYSGRLVESKFLPTDKSINEKNETLISNFWSKKLENLQRTDKGWFAEDVPVETIENFLVDFRPHPEFASIQDGIIGYLQEITEFYPVGDVLLVSIGDNDEDSLKYRLGSQKRRTATIKQDYWITSKHRVASRGDEKLGLTKIRQSEARKNAEEEGKEPSDYHYRAIRNKPLLMIHVLQLSSPNGNTANEEERVPAFGVSFPEFDFQKEIKVVANSVWIEKMIGPFDDHPDYDDDYDD